MPIILYVFVELHLLLFFKKQVLLNRAILSLISVHLSISPFSARKTALVIEWSNPNVIIQVGMTNNL